MITLGTNATAYSIANTLNKTNAEVESLSSQLSTGKREISGADVTRVDAHRAEDKALDIANRNIDEGKGLSEVTLKGMEMLQSIVGSMKELATQASSGTLNTEQRAQIQASFAELQTDYDKIIGESELYGQNLLKNGGTDVDIVTSDDAADKYTLTAVDLSAATTGINAATIDLTDATKAAAAITALDTAKDTIARQQSKFSTSIESLDWRAEMNAKKQEVLQESISNIEDLDVAQASADLAEKQVQSQLATALLAKANQAPQQLLQLIG